MQSFLAFFGIDNGIFFLTSNRSLNYDSKLQVQKFSFSEQMIDDDNCVSMCSDVSGALVSAIFKLMEIPLVIKRGVYDCHAAAKNN